MDKMERLSQEYLDGNLTVAEYQLKMIQVIAEMDYNNLDVLARRITFNEN